MGPTDLPATTPARFSHGPRWVPAALTCILCLHVILSCIGITWGLPSRKIDQFLFGDGEVWSGEKIYRLAHAGDKFSADRLMGTGADVDVDPLGNAPKGPVLLTATEEDVARIYLRYRLYTYQPDEMITMMALAGMRPGAFQLDPRLYQYGGLFIYPVGALIKLCGKLGLIDVRSDIVFYIDHPDEFGKFYVVARAYSAAWGLVGVIVVFALTRRFADAIRTPGASEGRGASQGSNFEDQDGYGSVAGLIAAVLFALMPVVVCMSHEGKPHLPGAMLMLLAVYLAILAVQTNRQSPIDNRKFFWLMCVCCGAAVGMVLSSWPICVLIPLVAIFQFRNSNSRGRGTEARRHEDTKGSWATALNKILLGGVAAVTVYFLTNPYVLINTFVNREVLRSNFGNSLAMYQIDRMGEGFRRVLELMVEGAALPVVVLGALALIVALATAARRSQAFWLLVAPSAMFFAQFVLIGAGKPPEYGRFGIFTNAALTIGVASLFAGTRLHRLGKLRVPVLVGTLVWIGFFGLMYLGGFYRDTTDNATRLDLAREIHSGYYGPEHDLAIGLNAEPAPYACPPLPFASREVWLLPESQTTIPDAGKSVFFIRTWGHSISWAGKSFSATKVGESEPSQ